MPYGVFHLLFPRLVYSRYKVVYNELVLATINVMFETNGILISKCMWSVINYFLFVS